MASTEDELSTQAPLLLSRAFRVTYYRLATQAAPGLIALLVVMKYFDLPFLAILFGTDADGARGWLGVMLWLVVLLLSFPIGLLLSGLSFFLFGWACLHLRAFFLGSFLVGAITVATGRPRALEDCMKVTAEQWAGYLQRVQLLLGKTRFYGPRSDDPEMILSVAIFARSLALVSGVSGAVTLLSSVLTRDLAGSVIGCEAIFLSIILFLFVPFAELYRDLALCIAAESLADYPYLESEAGWRFKRMLKEAQKILREEKPHKPDPREQI